MTELRVTALVEECERQAENCEYTSTSLYTWHKRARKWNALFVIAPIVLGGLASSQILTGYDAQWSALAAAFLALTAGFFPAIFEALKLDMRLREILQSANEFTNFAGSLQAVSERKAAFAIRRVPS